MKTRLRLNDAAFVTEIGETTLELQVFLDYSWENRIVSIKDGEGRTYRDDLALVLKTEKVRGYTLAAYSVKLTGNSYKLNEKELFWLDKIIAFIGKYRKININLKVLTPKESTLTFG